MVLRGPGSYSEFQSANNRLQRTSLRAAAEPERWPPDSKSDGKLEWAYLPRTRQCLGYRSMANLRAQWIIVTRWFTAPERVKG